MRRISDATLQALRDKFTQGTRVALVMMDDPQAPPIGTHGTVQAVDDMGSILISWDNGCGLNAVYGVDIVKVVND